MVRFEDLDIPSEFIKSLHDLGIENTTDIQEKTIPVALKGKDVVGSAQTGTGKTFAFLLPALTKILRKEINSCLIVEPTRELALQVIINVKTLLKYVNFIKYVSIIGGESYERQIVALEKNPQVFVGTPGRIIDHLNRGTLDLKKCGMVVLDETDKMFSIGFYEQLERIFEALPENRQTLMFSATFPEQVDEMIKKHLKDPEKIFVQSEKKANVIADKLVQEDVKLKKEEKYPRLVEELKKRDGLIIIFARTQKDVDWLQYRLRKEGFSVGGIHGGMSQSKRKRVVNMFKNGETLRNGAFIKYNILVGTDVIARGLDVQDVMHVINYSIPCDPEEYIHRIGRTARAGKNGFALSLICEEDEDNWQAVQEMLHPELKKERINNNNRKKFFGNRNRSFGGRSFHSRGRNTWINFGRKRDFGARKDFGDDLK